MGISDDIKPKNKIKTEPSVEIKIEENKPRIEANNSLSEDFFGQPIKTNQPDIKEKKDSKIGIFIHNLDKRYLWLLLVPILIITIMQNYSSITKSLSNSNKSNNANSNSPGTIYEGEIVPQDYTVNDQPNSNAANSNQTTQTPAPATEPVAVQAPDKSAISIKILNGNGISKSAASVKAELTKAGFNVTKVTNANNFNYTNTIIYYKNGGAESAELVKSTLSSRTATIEQSDDIVGSYSIVVVVGKN